MAKSKSDKKEESDDEFMKRIMDTMDAAKEKAKKEYEELSNTKEAKEARDQGKKIGDKMKEIEQCLEIQKEFEKDPPFENMIHINGMLAFIEYEEKYRKKIELMKKNCMSFLTARSDEIYWGAGFKTFGEVFLKRGGIMIPLSRSSLELPIIIRDGDIILTKDNSYVMELIDSGEVAEDEIRLFMFPNSEVKLSVKETVTIPEKAFMDSSSVPEVVKRKCKSVVHKFRVENIELLKGLVQVMIDKSQSPSNKDANRYITVSNVKFKNAAENFAGMLEAAMPKMTVEMKLKNPKMAAILVAQSAMRKMTAQKETGKTCSRLNFYAEIFGSTTVIFGTMDRLIVNGKPIELKSVSIPKYTISGSSVYVTDCRKNPDPRVTGVMEGAYAFINYAALLESEKNFLKSEGEVNVEKANENLKLARKIGDKLLIQIAEYKVIAAESEIGREKAQAERFSSEGLKSQKEEAEGMMAAAEETGEKEMIEVAKIQMAQTQKVIRKFSDDSELRNIMEKSLGGKLLTPRERMKLMVDTAEATGTPLTLEDIKEFEQAPEKLRKMKAEVEAKAKKVLPSYNSPNEKDRV
ncbi:MAG: hypothetical protein V1944_01825 [Candidatus Aenigmatarchaeota archaeon]